MNLFLLFWWLLKWFWLYGLLYFHHECTPGDGDGQGGLACCDSCWATELNWTDNFIVFSLFPEWHQLFVLSIFFFPCTSQSRGSYFLLPLELIYFIDCCMVSSWEFLSFFFFSSKWSNVSLILRLTFFFFFFGFTTSLDGAQLQILPESGFGENIFSSPWMSWKGLYSVLTVVDYLVWCKICIGNHLVSEYKFLLISIV